MTCKDCLYYEVCPLGLMVNGETGTCLKFKDKNDFVEVVRCKDCKWGGEITGIKKSLHCVKHHEFLEHEHFCSCGERKDT